MRLFKPALVAGALVLPLWAGLTRPGKAALGGIPPLPPSTGAAGGAVSEAFPFPVK